MPRPKRSSARRLFRCQDCGSRTFTLAQMLSANADTPDVCRRLRAMRAGETARFGGGAATSMWVRRVS